MVAKDPVTQKAVRVNPLVLETDHEKQLFAMGEGVIFGVIMDFGIDVN